MLCRQPSSPARCVAPPILSDTCAIHLQHKQPTSCLCCMQRVQHTVYVQHQMCVPCHTYSLATLSPSHCASRFQEVGRGSGNRRRGREPTESNCCSRSNGKGAVLAGSEHSNFLGAPCSPQADCWTEQLGSPSHRAPIHVKELCSDAC